jgi:tRNA dimethylallyltransferase
MSARKAVLLMGPTGAGKTAMALDIVRHFPLEIISVDSAMVYRGMDIGTAKPDLQTRLNVPHHLIDIREPTVTYSAGDFVLDAAKAMEDIWARGRHPLFVGGTMLYFHALSFGLADLPAADFRVRAEIDARAATAGWPAMHRELARVDPQAAARIHCNDAQRIQRALEVHQLSGQPISRLQSARSSVLDAVGVLQLVFAPTHRDELHRRLQQRFDAMLAAGLVEEVKALRQIQGLSAEHPTMRAVGYRQIWRYLAGECDLTEARETAVVATRQLAKRQLTWLRARSNALFVDAAHRDAASMIFFALSEGGFLS